ncbi:MAG: hypothetical protein FWE05_04470 [Defluviitaleaceae bacterium]|nr:hypothetical protein [Defluviitaleaceae bacterium]
MFKKLLAGLACAGMVCLMAISVVIAQPHIELYCYEYSDDVVESNPFIIGSNKTTED